MYPKLRAIAVAGMSVTILLLTASLAGAAPGQLDPTFGVAGLSSPSAPTDYNYGTYAMALQTDGKILTVGSESFMSGTGQMAVQRFNADGSLDTGFGGGDGVASFFPPGSTGTLATAVKVAGDGSIYVGGERYIGSTFEFVVAKLTNTGSLDPAFDGDAENTCGASAGNGIVCMRVSASPGTDRGRSLALDSNGDIVLAGSAYLAPGTLMAGVIRLKPNGTRDTTFGGDGRVTVPLTDNGWYSSATSVNVQTDGSLLLAGVAEGKGDNGLGEERYVDALGFARISSTGVPDATFHSVQSGYTGPAYTYGVILAPRGAAWSYGGINNATLEADGKLVATGYANNGSPIVLGSSAVTLRLTSSGELDSGFVPGGRSLIDFGTNNSGERVRVSSGLTYVSGFYGGTSGNQEFVARLNSAGLDRSIGVAGKVVIDDGQVSGSAGLEFQPDGKLVIAGTGKVGARASLARMLTADDPVIPPVTPPSATIISPKSKSLKKKNLHLLSGTAGPPGSVKSVEVALQRIDTKALKKKKRCYFLRSKKATFKSVKATNGKCSKPYYRTASGTNSWKYRITRTLPKGRYELTVRVTLLDGRTGIFSKNFKLK